MRAAGRSVCRKVGFHAVQNGWSLSHRVWLGWEDEASSPQAAAVTLPNDIASVMNWIWMLFLHLHPSFLELFSIRIYSTQPTPLPCKIIELRLSP